MAMEAEIVTVLMASMSPDVTVRTTAELQLTNGGTQAGFGLGLTRVRYGPRNQSHTRECLQNWGGTTS
jgi:hypothetical protein